MKIEITEEGLELIIYQLKLSEQRLQKRIDNYHAPAEKKQNMQKTLDQIRYEKKRLIHQIQWNQAYPKTNTENENKPIITKVSEETKPNFFQKFLSKLQTSK